MNRPAKTTTRLLAIALVAAGIYAVGALADAPAAPPAPTTRPVKVPFLTQPPKPAPEEDGQPSRPIRKLKPPRADLQLTNHDSANAPVLAARSPALDLPPLATTPNLPPPPHIVLPEKPRHKLDPVPERPFVLPAVAGRPRWAAFLPAPAVNSPSAFDGTFQPIQPMLREYIPDAAPTGLTPDINLNTQAEFDGVTDDDVPAIRTDLPARPAIPQ
ncbi:MAG: hypothetical protein ABSH20_15870 [Tepidisphaeraceae bacterium]|jgi:hypothetical protein